MDDSRPLPRSLGRYLLYDEIAAGGMATVHVGRLLGPAGFSRTVAIKRLHPQFAKDPEFVSMFLDEARLAARIRHPNVVSTLDVVAREGELFLVMDYVQGLSLSRLVAAARRSNRTIPTRVASAILVDTLLGLQAAHEARNDRGDPLGIVHRDISPQNILVGADGIARVVDFGVAKAASRAQTTREGQIKGKLAYMSPEQVQSRGVDQRTDIFAASIVLWETLSGRRLFASDEPAATVADILTRTVEPPSKHNPTIDAQVDAVVLKGLARARSERFGSAREMARALQEALPPANSLEIEDWLASVAGDILQVSGRRVAQIEENSSKAADDPNLFAGAPSVKTVAMTPSGIAQSTPSSHASAAAPLRPLTQAPEEVTDLSASSGIAPLSIPLYRSRSVRVWLAAGGFAALAVAVLALRGGSADGVVAPKPTPASAAESAARSATDVAVQPAPPKEAAKPSEGSELVASPKPVPAPAPASSAVRGSKTRPGPVRVAAPAGAVARPSCDPPYTLKADGSKRFKPECF
ncbi:MAG: protein kinase [Polyangiaceae bacterium]